jgi:hypothetical protein
VKEVATPDIAAPVKLPFDRVAYQRDYMRRRRAAARAAKEQG